MATLHAELTRKGPGVLLKDIAKGKDPQIKALQSVLTEIRPDILLLTKVDIETDGLTLETLKRTFGFAHGIARMPNSNRFVQADMDGDGWIPAHGERMAFAPFAGAGAMVLLSQSPIRLVRDHSDLLWQNLPNADLPITGEGQGYFSKAALAELRLVTYGLWHVETDGLTVLVFQNTAPVFDGPEDRNGKRSADQLRFIEQVINHDHGTFPETGFVLMGNTNLDPQAGEGDRAAMAKFLSHPALQDPTPRSAQGGLNTAFWDKPGPMRVSYILPSADLDVTQAEVLWPEAAEVISRHRMVVVEITR